MYKTNPPESKYEQLVIVLDMIRGIYEERQLEHDAKLKHVSDASRKFLLCFARRLSAHCFLRID